MERRVYCCVKRIYNYYIYVKVCSVLSELSECTKQLAVFVGQTDGDA